MSVLRNLSSYLPLPVAARLLQAPEQSLLGWEERFEGVVLFADMADFTPLAETLGQAGPAGTEELTQLLNGIFTPLIEIVHQWGGAVGKFAGDAMSVLFKGAAAVERALACAWSLREHLDVCGPIETLAGPFVLGMRLGLAAGPVLETVVGNERRAEFVYAGRPLAWAAEAEQRARPGEVLLHPSLVERIPVGLTNLDPRVEGYQCLRGLEQNISPLRPAAPALPPDPGRAILELFPFHHPLIYERLLSGQQAFINEHRRITLFFAGFEGIDYEHADAASRLGAYVSQVVEVIAEYDGYLCRVDMADKGSRLLVLFGAPVAHEDDEERALLCALDLQRRVAHLETITVQRIGLNSGRVFVGDVGSRSRQEYTAIGDAVNLAARLMQAAAPGQILVGPACYSAVGPSFVCRQLPPLRVKGKAAPVAACELLAWEDSPGLPVSRYALPMVGRREELSQLLQLAQQVRETGRGQVVGITAEAGLGKSRLVAEFVGQTLELGLVGLGGGGVGHGSTTPYLAWRPLLRGLLGLGQGQNTAKQVETLRQHLAALHPELPLRLPLLGDALGLTIPDNELTASFDANLRKESLFALVVDLLQARAARAPLLLVLEDAHWLDELSRELVRHVAQQIVDRPILFLTVYRPPEIQGQEPLWSAPPAHLTELRLGPFSPDETSVMLRLKLADRELPAALLEQLELRAQGNPFFIDEFINLILEQGLDLDDPAALAQLRVPDSLQALIISRLDRLGETEKMTIRVASVIGQLFRAGWLLAIYPEAIRERLLPHDLKRLSALELLLPDKPDPELTYLFKHAITHEVVYGTLSFSNRRMLHERVAAHIEKSYADDLGAWYGILAYHYKRADRPRQEFAWVLRAGERASRQYALQQAADFHERAIELIREHGLGSPEIEFDLRHELFSYRQQLGQSLQLERDVQPLLDMAGQLDPPRQVRAQLLYARFQRITTDRWEQAAAIYERVAELAHRHGDQLGLLEAWAGRGGVYFTVGDYAAGKELLSRVIANAGEAGWKQEWSASLTLGWIAYDEGDYALAERCWQRALQLARTRGVQPIEAEALKNLGVVYETRCYIDRALDHLERSLSLSVQMGNKVLEQALWGILGETWMNSGEYERALECLRRSVEMADRVPDDVFGRAYTRSRLAKAVLEGAGDLETADRLIRHSLDAGRSRLAPETFAWILNVWGQVLQQQGDLHGARQAWEEAAAIRRQIQQVDWLLLTLAYLGRLHLQMGQVTHARELLQEMLELLFRQEDEPRESVAAGLACFHILRALGEDVRARDLLDYAYETLQRQAARIETEAYRRSFLERVPLHRETVAVYREILG